jgi:hypothetical protein
MTDAVALISDCNIGEHGAIAVAQALHEHSSLQCINLYCASNYAVVRA